MWSASVPSPIPSPTTPFLGHCVPAVMVSNMPSTLASQGLCTCFPGAWNVLLRYSDGLQRITTLTWFSISIDLNFSTALITTWPVLYVLKDGRDLVPFAHYYISCAYYSTWYRGAIQILVECMNEWITNLLSYLMMVLGVAQSRRCHTSLLTTFCDGVHRSRGTWEAALWWNEVEPWLCHQWAMSSWLIEFIALDLHSLSLKWCIERNAYLGTW